MNALRNIWAIVGKEWRHYFGSPIAYVALFIWALIFGFFFFSGLSFFVQDSMQAAQQMEFGGFRMSLNDRLIRGLMLNSAVVALFVMPMMTMRLFAEEKKQGTIELLMTSPLTNLQIILGKFFAALGLYATMILVGLANLSLLWHYASVPPEWKPVAAGALALLLVGAAFLSLGLFLSTLTSNQIVAGTLTFGLTLLFWVLAWLDNPAAGGFTRMLTYLGLTSHIDEMVKGVIELKDVVFYLSFIAFGLFLAHQSVESQRWRA